jgi:N-acetylglucosamine-6-phosphate deacetylase
VTVADTGGRWVRRYDTGEVVRLQVRDGLIAALEPAPGQADSAPAVPEGKALPECTIAPSLFDLQINGALGCSFGDPTLTGEALTAVVRLCRSHGIGGFLATVITDDLDRMQAALANLRRLREQSAELAAMIPGFHLEGPWLSAEDGPRGAHPRAYIRTPEADDFARLQEAAGGLIRLVTLAPELPGALRLIEYLRREGVVVSIGHTAASPQQIRDGFSAGATMSTHLGNGCHAVLPRHANYLWEQLDADAWASVIADGQHLPDAVLRCIVRLKAPRVVLTCDASPLAGLTPGRYILWGQTVELHDTGRVSVVGTPYLAGSGVLTDFCVWHLHRVTRLPLATVIAWASQSPREVLGLPVPTLAVGQPAVLFEWTEATARECTIPAVG